MSYDIIRRIPSPEEMIAEVPLPKDLQDIKIKKDEEIRNVFTGKDDRFIVIIGPCSASDEDALCDYVSRLAKVNEKVKDKLLIIPRIYTNKPRTTGDGYKGMLHQPDPEKDTNIYEGIKTIRKMHIRAMNESGLTAADEMLYPENLVYVRDMLSYIAIGARSVENQQHRLVSSAIDVPVGMKNPTSGDITVMLNSIYAAQLQHEFLYRESEIKTSGNPLSHAILRGSVNKHGQSQPNYHYEDLVSLAEQYNERNLKNPAIIVDVNHANSKKVFSEQPRIVSEVLHSRCLNQSLKSIVKGIMIESFIEEGNQKITDHIYGKSITDGCLGWKDSERLLYSIAEKA